MSEAFVFSPPKTVAMPSKSRSSSSDAGSSSKKGSRLSKAAALQTIKEESSVSRTSEDDTVSASPLRR